MTGPIAVVSCQGRIRIEVLVPNRGSNPQGIDSKRFEIGYVLAYAFEISAVKIMFPLGIPGRLEVVTRLAVRKAIRHHKIHLPIQRLGNLGVSCCRRA